MEATASIPPSEWYRTRQACDKFVASVSRQERRTESGKLAYEEFIHPFEPFDYLHSHPDALSREAHWITLKTVEADIVTSLSTDHLRLILLGVLSGVA